MSFLVALVRAELERRRNANPPEVVQAAEPPAFIELGESRIVVHGR